MKKIYFVALWLPCPNSAWEPRVHIAYIKNCPEVMTAEDRLKLQEACRQLFSNPAATMLDYISVDHGNENQENADYEMLFSDLQAEDRETLVGIDKETTLNAMKNHEGRGALAAKELGISQRMLFQKVRKYDLCG